MKEKLIELIEDTLQEWECDVSDKTISEIAEHLIQNGVLVPPCKVGDEVWVVFEWDSEPMQGEITMVQQQFDKSWNLWVSRHLAFNATAIGETVFFSREEAEKKLKERERCQT